MKTPVWSIVIPAYQEAGRIEHTLSELMSYLQTHDYHDVEVLVVVADSSDGTAQIVKDYAAQHAAVRLVPAGPKVGKGFQVRLGMLEAAGAHRLFMDADLATPLHHLEEVRQLMEHHGAEVVIAVRDLTDSHTGLRRWISSLGNRLVRLMLLPGIGDTQCGFKAFSAQAAEELFRRQYIVKWGFDMEILAIARKLGYKIEQIKAPDWHDRPEGSFEDAAITGAAITTLLELLVIFWRRWTGGYRRGHYRYRRGELA